MNGAQDAVHFQNNRPPFVAREMGQMRLVIGHPIYHIHHVKRRSDDAGIFTKPVHFGHRNRAAAKRVLHAKFALNRMRRFEQDTGRFAPQNIAP